MQENMDNIKKQNMQAFIETLKYEEILVFTPGEAEYERSVATANLLYRYSRPDCVVQPKRSSQVQIIVNEAREKKIKITIKNGGHSYAGFSTAGAGTSEVDVGISLDLSKMNIATLSRDQKNITLQGGCLWGHAYKQLVNNAMYGHVINGGRCPTVGVSGFLLGAGLGPFSRSLGMGCDSLEQATLVTADGKLVTVKRSDTAGSDEGKLFWALCGGGGGNFGVVVELKMPVQTLSGEEVVAGRFTWTPRDEALTNFIPTMNKFYTSTWPRYTTIDSSWLQETTSKSEASALQVRFLVYHDGSKTSFDQTIDENIEDIGLRDQIKRRILKESSTRFLHETLVAQWSEEIVKAFPTNRTFSLYTSFVFTNAEATIKIVTPIIKKWMDEFGKKFVGDVCLLQVTWIHGGDTASGPKGDATAFPWREGNYHTYIMAQWEEKYLESEMQHFLAAMKAELRSYSLQKQAAFINFADPIFSSEEYADAYFGTNYPKLQEVKSRWDKNNFFDWSQGVKPTDWRSPPRVKEHDHTDEIAKERFAQFQPAWIPVGSYPGLDGVPAMGGLSKVEKPIGLTDLGF